MPEFLFPVESIFQHLSEVGKNLPLKFAPKITASISSVFLYWAQMAARQALAISNILLNTGTLYVHCYEWERVELPLLLLIFIHTCRILRYRDQSWRYGCVNGNTMPSLLFSVPDMVWWRPTFCCQNS